ncbi:hypothetical protein [Mycolicibacterium goodii]|uniref:Uncharacterized protein n=1 Tax=Mycolicibacterium goodii TaxID=134601 RepID=A0ABS6HNS7_MYCGD|nr:hypothetical protein [Mycolicibacterium goodii]OKH75350.1 membrane protein [Mycobacterium sp. SWH-M5]MBU8807945.1 hypothetical protein [Mycolicibacterium goodii]MBU8815359.1 hypothetical protein [Mycolicibacterium goodii]MBU8824357.1 hypothetical protein [Mycolicibacterium goodii]MBU8827935.1 hypothetical protein [Mycolicibacterium goodii]
MSWLLVALIPGLLMLATFGLDRLEAGLTRDQVPSRAKTTARGTAAASTARPVSELHHRELVLQTVGSASYDAHLPTRRFDPQATNPEFPATRHADRV